jgi:hypothetical protein
MYRGENVHGDETRQPIMKKLEKIQNSPRIELLPMPTGERLRQAEREAERRLI